jgi:hypothetical protein
MYGRKTYADHTLVINNKIISGVTSFNGDFNIPYENIDVLGNNFINTIQGEITKEISFSRFLMNSDPLKSLTGNIFCNGFVSYGNQSYGFEKGYLTNYNASCSIGEIAEINTDFIVFGNIGGVIQHPILPSNYEKIYVANASSITVNANEGEDNRIVSFNYNVTCERIPLFVLGSTYPEYFFLKKPVTIDLSINVDIDDYQSNFAHSLICNPNIQTITINLYNCDQTQIIETFRAPSARLISNSYEVSTTTQSNVELTFRSFLM